ncbi:MAG: LapA family protein [Rhodocyclaceae bacterium]|nr:LapA family protein [Rhodocyclaceae bacterium]MDZ4215404.1 LapA family protein [Rhodocyclaceae bacterium]
MKRYVYIALIVIVTAVVLLFKVQNIDSVTVSLLTLSLTMPLSLLLIGVYVLGMFTGSFIVGLLRDWLHGARAPKAAAD